MSADKVRIKIGYWAGWGYKPFKFHKLETELKDIFGDEIEMVGESTRQVTDWLEVEIVGGKLLHSKQNEDGYVDSKAKDG